ncbi:hypothetical protein BSS2_I0201 [Brucella suis bv. 1 str. S2]|uniref:Uncharacterized protein n=5 Tax=Brucella TaxID=234 RepID=Q2YP64_BRUA2|nr:hypothetical protein BR0209 [Brucella suis 1330]AAX73613.1 hypothetical protein BruAb1_0204 [Brucella abortus bv. 1 str. 9-941]ACU47227.1 hypothetical protein BMI_I212 [Brucella microti CCM 4915]AEK53524.1 hypothetical protein BPI_I210 [Brucella pinnipedialis B2/94]AEU05238.1 hypothetical protein BSVBI22_A0209 [Brucella suis VBI22]AHN45867.1 hypothetical protein BSS2_I0201 [Brucella suis bv. 1 str. S2]EEX81682.1 predicted protein [Brucella abortus bv. 9 str. C68]EEX86669.1 predicted prote
MHFGPSWAIENRYIRNGPAVMKPAGVPAVGGEIRLGRNVQDGAEFWIQKDH